VGDRRSKPKVTVTREAAEKQVRRLVGLVKKKPAG